MRIRVNVKHTEILAVFTEKNMSHRIVEIQVKAARGSIMNRINWPLNTKVQRPSLHECEYFVLVAIPNEASLPPRNFIVPRSHIATTAWIQHMHWLTEPGVPPGKRNAPV